MRHLQQKLKNPMMLFIIVAMMGLSFALLAEEVRRNWHSTLPGFPEIPSTSSTQRTSELGLISRAARPIGTVGTVVVNNFGVIQPFRVTAPDGSVFFVDSIDSPNCAVYANYVGEGFANTDFTVASTNPSNNTVTIGTINFDGCR